MAEMIIMRLIEFVCVEIICYNWFMAIVACNSCFRPIRFIKNALGNWEPVNIRSGATHRCFNFKMSAEKARSIHAERMKLKNIS